MNMENDFVMDQNIVVLCEGDAERAIIDVLVDNKLLCFSREEMFKDGKVRSRNFRDFQKNHLELIKVSKKLVIYRVQDDIPKSMTSPNVLPQKQYEHMIDKVVFVITRPEIEMLMIIYNDLEKEYIKYLKKAKTPKPSSFIKQHSKEFSKCKNYDFVYSHFSSDPSKLIMSLKKYHLSKKHKDVIQINSDFISIYDLLNLSE